MTQPERPYVILTVREVAQGEDLRNRDIKEFEASILRLIETGHNVIRLTSHTNNPLQFESPHLLDWQVTKFGKQGDELALVSGASFVISTTTGIDCLALALRRPVLYVDVARLFYVFLGTELTTFQMPQMTDWESGEPINLQQLLERGVGFSKNPQSFVDARVKIVNSSPEQLAQVIREYATNLSLGHPPDDDALQVRWRELVLHHLRDEVTSRHGAIRARMHPATLRSHL
jgi:putative glycosyltransferase (TIGR04372 family)